MHLSKKLTSVKKKIISCYINDCLKVKLDKAIIYVSVIPKKNFNWYDSRFNIKLIIIIKIIFT